METTIKQNLRVV